MPFFSTRRRVRNENLTSLRGGARMLKSCQLLRLEKTLQNSRISCQNRAKAAWRIVLYILFYKLGQKINDVLLTKHFLQDLNMGLWFSKDIKKTLQTVP